MNNETIFMVDNMRLWRETHDKNIDKICNGMTESERKAYCMGVDNLYNLFHTIIESNYSEGHYTVLYPDDNIEPSEYDYDDFYTKVHKENINNMEEN